MSDIDFDARTVHVEREKVKGEGKWVLGPPKSEHGVRDVNMSPQLTAVLRRVVEVERAKDKLRRGWKAMSPWVFYADRDPDAYAHETDGTLDDSNVRRVMRRVLAALPADFPKHFTPHGARHTFASLLSAEGKDIQYIREQLGHESIKLTADTYGGWLCRKDQHASDCLDDPDWDSVTTQG